jgi:1-acyl-sn-glycerol-3-phosphate acyltransferase
VKRPWLIAGFRALLRLYYPRTTASHLERLPAQGPVIVVANHPNGLMDGIVLQNALDRPLRFLGKSTFWNNPIGRFTMESLEVLPAHRAHESDTSKNELTFSLCRDHLAGGGWLALFPEGKSHSETTLQPLKTGAARIALSAAAAGTANLQLLPVGLIFEEKETFRSAVSAVVGHPIAVADLLDAYADDPRAAAVTLTKRIHAALAEVVLQAHDGELLRGFVAVATWTAEDGGADLAARDRRALRLAAAARALAASEPDRLDALVVRTRRFATAMQDAGISDPFAVEQPASLRLFGGLLLQLALLPLALVGAAFAWLPYRAVGPIAVRIAGTETDIFGTAKVLLGLLVLTVTYLAWAVAAAFAIGPLAGLATLIVAPLTGLAALRFDERWQRRKQALRGLWVASQSSRAAALVEARRDLCAEVEAALREA